MLSLDDNGPAPLPQGPFNLAAHVLAAGRAHPDKTALEIVDTSGVQTRMDFGAVTRAVCGIATGLTRMGLVPGDRILMRLGNSPAFPMLFLGAIAAGLVPVPTPAHLTATEVDALNTAVRPRLIVADPNITPGDAPPCPVLPASNLTAMHALPAAEFRMGDAARLAFIIFTSGTSGVPRGVCHAHQTIFARDLMARGWTDLGPGDRILHAGALNWTYTLGCGVLDPWRLGAAAILPAQGIRAAELPGLISRHKVTVFAAAPGVYRQMLKDEETLDLPGLRHGLSAGEKLPEQLRSRFTAATGCKVFEAFGMSECSTFISGNPGRPAPQNTLGYAQPGRRIAVLDPNGSPVPRGTEGLLAISRKDIGLMIGYLDAPEETLEKQRGEWFLTGDRAVMLADGAIGYRGRNDDMMNAGGFKVSPFEVETAVNGHPAVTECAAATRQLKPGVEGIALWYVAETDPGEAALVAFAKERLAAYKMPRAFHRVPRLPKSQNGKILRRILREESDVIL